MNGAQQILPGIRRALSLALILLFGPAPLISLLAQSDEPQCQMACCKRQARMCALHRSSASDSVSGIGATNSCIPGCSHTAGVPSLFAGFLPATISSIPLRGASNRLAPAGIRPIRSVVDSFLYQRPPPLLAS